ncbi:MAG: YckD family protein [Bacillota bacterium]
MKKLILLVLAIVLLAAAIPAAYATITDQKQQEIDQLHRQMAELKKQLVEKYVEAGLISPEQGILMQERIEQMLQNRQGPGMMLGPGGCFLQGNGGCPRQGGRFNGDNTRGMMQGPWFKGGSANQGAST